jgi:transcriptional regulator with XRE-family HTH domain
MCMTINNQENFRRVNRQVWGRMFSLFIQKGREKRGQSVEEAARLAGMEPFEWAAVEAGRVPETAEQLRSMAGALEFSDAQLATVVCLCRDAWEA